MRVCTFPWPNFVVKNAGQAPTLHITLERLKQKVKTEFVAYCGFTIKPFPESHQQQWTWKPGKGTLFGLVSVCDHIDGAGYGYNSPELLRTVMLRVRRELVSDLQLFIPALFNLLFFLTAHCHDPVHIQGHVRQMILHVENMMQQCM